MTLRLTVRSLTGDTFDVGIDANPSTTIREIAQALRDRKLGLGPEGEAITLASVDGERERLLDPDLSLSESLLGSGATVTLKVAARQGRPSRWSMSVTSGPDAGVVMRLMIGLNSLGRDKKCDLVLNDPLVSKRHARVVVEDSVEIIDDNSANGLVSDGRIVERIVLAEGDELLIGDSAVTLKVVDHEEIEDDFHDAKIVFFNRSPRVDRSFSGETFDVPEPPSLQRPQRFPVFPAAMPLFMGAAIFAATRNPLSIVFIAMSPLMLLGSYLENRRNIRSTLEEETLAFREQLAFLVARVQTYRDLEQERRRDELPSAATLLDAVNARESLLWTRRPEHERFLNVRLGLGSQPSRSDFNLPNTTQSKMELVAELHEAIDPLKVVRDVPIGFNFRDRGSLGIAGEPSRRADVASGIVAQLACLHSPADLVIAAMASPTSAERWMWLKWLPHIGSSYSPLATVPLASSAGSVAALVDDLDELVSERLASDEPVTLPRIIVVVEDDAPFDRSRLVPLAELASTAGIHFVWNADRRSDLPAMCKGFVTVDTSGSGATGDVELGEVCEPIVVEALPIDAARWLGRRLAPVVDASAGVLGDSNLPARISFATETGLGILSDPDVVLDRWRESNSIHGLGDPTPASGRENTLRAFVGKTSSEGLHLDLRTQGPHALVGGTTGAGKSEFLQTWVLSMATSHSPQRVTFLFVDYKGGAAFADCVDLPHSVGLVTDLSPHLVQRALRSLNAELRFREHYLNERRAKDLAELEQRGDGEALPSLVIVVDEFAALIQEVPEFVDGIINVAQRGRSLGLHLVLATQRPAGVIRGNLRANTNLRIALRMADDDDSTDVVGVPLAAGFDPSIPGRGLAKTGPGRLSTFQTAYVGGSTSKTPPPAAIVVHDLTFGSGEEWVLLDEPEPAQRTIEVRPPDIQQIVSNVRNAVNRANIDDPRRPWLPELSSNYDLATLGGLTTPGLLPIGTIDHPDEQSQKTAFFRLDQDGSLAFFGAGGSGTTTALRTVAASAGLGAPADPSIVYAIDFGSRGLNMIEVLPHVGSVISGDDTERIVRLMRDLRSTMDDRADRYSAVNAGSILEYRHKSQRSHEERILLLIDGFSSFRSTFEVGPTSWVNDALLSLAGEGRPLGIHIVITADRPASVPASITGAIQRRVYLRLANDEDAAMTADIPRGGFEESSPPGRGYLLGDEIQVAVYGGAQDVTGQASSLKELAEELLDQGVPLAPAIGRLPERVELESISSSDPSRPTFAISDDDLQPFAFSLEGPFLITGPPRSGRSTALTVLTKVLGCGQDGRSTVLLASRRSDLSRHDQWCELAVGAAEVAVLSQRLDQLLRAESGKPAFEVVLIEGVGELVNSEADFPLTSLIKACRSQDILVIAEGELSEVSGSWPLLQSVRSSRHGLILQPDQLDGDVLFRTPFPKLQRRDFPPGRGYYVNQGRVHRIQVALP